MSTGPFRIRHLVAAAAVAPFALLAMAGGTSNNPEVACLTASGSLPDDDALEAHSSADGEFVVFRSNATNLVPEVTSTEDCIYLRDRVNGTTTVMSDPDGNPITGSYNPFISADGRYVLFQTYTPVLAPDEEGFSDLYRFDRKKNRLTMVSLALGKARPLADCWMDGASMSADGKYAAFYSIAYNLTKGLSGNATQIFRVDMKKRKSTLVSRGYDGNPADGTCGRPSISGNGKYIVFESIASNLVEGVGSANAQIYRWDSKTKRLTHASPAFAGGNAGAECIAPVVSDLGTVAFESAAQDLLAVAEGDSSLDVFLRNPVAGTTIRVSQNPGGAHPAGDAGRPSIDSTGTLVAFATGQALLGNDNNEDDDAYVFNAVLSTLTLVSRNGGGNAGNGDSTIYASSFAPGGLWLVYGSEATDLAAGDFSGNDWIDFIVDPRL